MVSMVVNNNSYTVKFSLDKNHSWKRPKSALPLSSQLQVFI